jgi:hypothetical protein
VDSGINSRQPTVSPKKCYLKPELRVYGNIEKITLQGRIGVLGDNVPIKDNLRTGG